MSSNMSHGFHGSGPLGSFDSICVATIVSHFQPLSGGNTREKQQLLCSAAHGGEHLPTQTGSVCSGASPPPPPPLY